MGHASDSDRARRYWKGLSHSERWALGDALVLGTFDWREWGMHAKPTRAFLDALDEERIYWESENHADTFAPEWCEQMMFADDSVG